MKKHTPFPIITIVLLLLIIVAGCQKETYESRYGSYALLVSGPYLFSKYHYGTHAVVFKYESDVATNMILSLDSSPYPIYGQFKYDTLFVHTKAKKIISNQDCRWMFAAKAKAECYPQPHYEYDHQIRYIDFGDGFVINENAVNMDNMFWHSDISSIDIFGFNHVKVASMVSMFECCSRLTSLDLSHFNTDNVTSMENVFNNCSRLTTLDISGFRTNKVTNMENMFRGCASLAAVNFPHVRTDKVTNMTSMFEGCAKLATLDLSGFNTSNVAKMDRMFYNCKRLELLNLYWFTMDSSTTKTDMFAGLATESHACTIACLNGTRPYLENGTSLPIHTEIFHWYLH